MSVPSINCIADILYLAARPISNKIKNTRDFALFSYSRSFGNGPRHFEPWSRKKTPQLAPYSFITFTPTGEREPLMEAKVVERDRKRSFLGKRGGHAQLTAESSSVASLADHLFCDICHGYLSGCSRR
ncbi:hypothetical protein TNCV_5041651 [Trichonephila clavipes]|nr:hypothetical protein TNCV_5041651 [Trichonephila clavipes]